jgi:AraC-like DNA-binding protein
MDSNYVKTIKLSVLDGLELKEAVFQKHSFPDHFHDTYCIRLMEMGLEFQFTESNPLIAHAGSILILNPREVHSNRNYDNDFWKYRTIFVNAEVISYVQEIMHLKNSGTIFFTNQIIDDQFLFMKILDFHNSISTHSIRLLFDIIAYLIKNYRVEDKVHPHSNWIVTDSQIYLKANFSKKITIDDLACKYKVNKFHFIRMFRKHTGLPPMSYVLLHRVIHAKKLITDNLSMINVALDSGFYDQSHFNHCFRRYIGVSPLEYRIGFHLK